MNASPSAALSGFAPLRIGVHVLVGVSIAVVSLFTALAWPFAIGVGMALGSADAREMRGEHEGLSSRLGRELLVLIGILGMIFFGAIIGGLVAILVVVLTVFSEKAAAHASPTDRGVARILLLLVPAVAWLVVFPLLGLQVDIRIGG